MDQVQGIMCFLGHQLEEEIAGKELLREQSQRLQSSDKLYNATDWRKLSEGRVLDRAALIKLRDAFCVRKAATKTKRQPPTTPCSHPTPTTSWPTHVRTNIVTISKRPHLLVMDSEEVSTKESSPEDICDSEWSSVIILGPSPSWLPGRTLPPPSQRQPTSTTYMILRSH
ncbi:hypothetical protein HOY80DRAFT_1106531 [Tuber brumale]|nr:hypothetical protein HOY80DRAFT_1106531 [Tuber brumale]